MAGLFITLEGGDGVGKTTQFELLVAALVERGFDVCALHEPGGTAVGERIRALLLDKELGGMDPVAELLLFEAARAQLVSEVIEPALAAGKIVVCDRFYDSTLAYQGYGRQLGVELCAELNKIACHGRTPDITVLLELGQAQAAARVVARAADGQGDRMEAAGSAFHERVAAGFAALAAAEPERIRTVDAAGSIEEVHERVMAAVAAPVKGSGTLTGGALMDGEK